jgi:hypothetical protein
MLLYKKCMEQNKITSSILLIHSSGAAKSPTHSLSLDKKLRIKTHRQENRSLFSRSLRILPIRVKIPHTQISEAVLSTSFPIQKNQTTLRSTQHCLVLIYLKKVLSQSISRLSVIHFLRIHIVIHHTMISHLLILRAWTAIVDVWIDGDSAARCELAPYFDVAWVH